MMHPQPTWLLYDGECRICTAFASWIAWVDARDSIRVQPIQESRELLRSLPSERILDAVHAVNPDGQVTTGPDALPAILSALLDGPRLEGLLRASPVAMGVLSHVYGLLVTLRAGLSCGFAGPSFLERNPR